MNGTRWLLVALVGGLLLHGQPAVPGPAPSSRLDRVQASSQLAVCIWPGYHGISYRHPITQEIVGLDADMAREFAKDLGVGLRFVDSTFASLIADVTGDRCDVAMFGIGVIPSRSRFLRFASPHLASGIYAITTRSNRRIRDWADIDRRGVVVAVLRGSVQESAMSATLKEATLLVLDSPEARERDVESGRADVFMTDYPYSRRMLDGSDWARLVSPPTSYHLTPYAYAVAPGDDRWHARLEAFVSAVKRDGRLLDRARRYKLESIVVER